MSLQEMSKNPNFSADGKYFCRCCGYNALQKFPDGTYEICEICFWEDDQYQTENPKEKAGPNYVSLIEARNNFEKFSACQESMIVNVRKVNSLDFRNPKI